MGFSSALYVYPKYKDITYQDILSVEAILSYETNKWAQEHFPSAEEYAKYELEDKYIPQSPDRLDFYRRNLVEDEFSHKQVYKDYGYWCSGGIPLHEKLLSNLGTSTNENDPCGTTRILSKADIAQLMQYCLDKILEHMPQPATISHAYKYQRDEDGDIAEDSAITLFNVDGFEVEYEDEDGHRSLQRIDTNPEWECCFGFPKQYMDEWEFNGYVSGLESAAKMLGEVDFDNSIVIYSGGW